LPGARAARAHGVHSDPAAVGVTATYPPELVSPPPPRCRPPSTTARMGCPTDANLLVLVPPSRDPDEQVADPHAAERRAQAPTDSSPARTAHGLLPAAEAAAAGL